MKRKKVDLLKIQNVLLSSCPFISFAFIQGPDSSGFIMPPGNIDLAVYLDGTIGTYQALERILPVMTHSVPQVFCELTILNRVDPITRYNVLQKSPLFIREKMENQFSQFVRKTNLDYRILRAQYRRRGLLSDTNQAMPDPSFILSRENFPPNVKPKI
ncbi:MAG: hypothetical protein EOM90_10260 [Alphaproteobacteria bacterium]|nr:hypothetical protein [Alphaproteobacteria bacterium]